MIDIQKAMRLCILALIALFLSACAFESAQRQSNDLYNQGRLEEAVLAYRPLLVEEPNNAKYRVAYYTTRDKAIAELLTSAERSSREGRPEEAQANYQRVLRIDDRNVRAQEGIAAIEASRRHAKLLERAKSEFERGHTSVALEYLRSIQVENPGFAGAAALRSRIEDEQRKPRQATEQKLADAFRSPISIEFRDAQLKQVFEILSRTSGLNFVLDREVKGDQKTTIFLRNSTVAEALALTLLTNQLEQRVLNSSSVLIYPNTAAKLREYEPLAVKSFVLNYGEAKNVANTLKTILKTKDVVVEEKQNLIIMRDSPDAIRMAEKLIRIHDQPEPEVMLDVEILEVKRSKLLELGIQYPSQLSLTPLSTGAGTSVHLYDLLHMNSNSVGASVNPLSLNANNTISDVNVLANPRIRTRNKEKAQIQVGQRLPNITSTSTSTGFVAESVQYVDVGLKLEVEPAVSLEGDVAIKIGLEVSNILDKIQTKNGSIAYEIGTRNANTVLRLRDGQNQILAGLINSEERAGTSQIPGLGNLPILGRLFGSGRDETLKSEIVLSITPHVVRAAQPLESGFAEFDSGTESSLHARAIDGLSSPATVPNSGSARPTGATSAREGTQDQKPSGMAGAASTSSNPGTPSTIGSTTAGTSTALTQVSTNSQSTGGFVSDNPKLTSASRLFWGFEGEAKVGSTCVVTLNVNLDDAVLSTPLSFTYDPDVLSLVSIDLGDFTAKGGDSAVLSQRVDVKQGLAKVLVQSSGASGAKGSGALIRLSLKPLKTVAETRISLGESVVASGLGGKAVELGNVAPYVLSVQ
ncbi:MAG: general secretion pathway protein GspD [Uliginosibacterium sp.]|nr:general secretion pathway protein GspD [Uliginosibacterium sp.]